MNLFQVIAGIVELLFSLIVGVLFIYGSFQLFKFLTRDMDEIAELKKNNIAVGIFYGAVILSVCLMVKEAMGPAIDSLIAAAKDPDSRFTTYLVISGVMLAQLLISGALAFFGVYAGVRVFMGLTKDIEEIEEVNRNNVAVAIILAAIVVSIALFLSPGIRMIMEGLLPYPAVR